MTDAERDNGLRRLQWASLVVCGILLLMVLFTMLFSLASKNSANAVKGGNDAATCRSQFSARVTDARTNLDNARAEVNVAQFDGLVAATIESNDDALAAAIKRGRDASKLIAEWQAKASQANEAYQNLLSAEVEDHPQFEKLCREGPT